MINLTCIFEERGLFEFTRERFSVRGREKVVERMRGNSREGPLGLCRNECDIKREFRLDDD